VRTLIKDYIQNHPFLIVIIIAILVRIPAVLWSEGYIHSDDHFETIHVAYGWANGDFWGDDGYLRWKNTSADNIGRFPLYTLFLYSIMKLYQSVGITSLNTIMYGIRAIHALLSLIPIFAAFMIARFVTGKNSWAILAGLAIAINFSFPFLGVRNLIEVVGGNIWAISLFFLYRYQWKGNEKRDLFIAGILSGLAWMIRFQIASAIIPIPFILWFIARDIKPAIHYSMGVSLMLLISGITDYFLLGSFASSTFTLLSRLNNSPMYNTTTLMYPLEILLFLIPPISFLAYYLIFRPSFWKKHLLLFISTISFFLFHMSLANQQERFIFPMIPIVIILFILAIWDKYKRDGYVIKYKKVFRWLLISSAILNFMLLIFLTPASGHYGLVKSMTWWEEQDSTQPIIIIKPHLKKIIPLDYAGFKSSQISVVGSWDDLNSYRINNKEWKNWEYYFLYPNNENELEEYLDSINTIFGPVTLHRTIEPSSIDNLLHSLNPKHNPSYKTWIYKREIK
jgi:hypothetical protein